MQSKSLFSTRELNTEAEHNHSYFDGYCTQSSYGSHLRFGNYCGDKLCVKIQTGWKQQCFCIVPSSVSLFMLHNSYVQEWSLLGNFYARKLMLNWVPSFLMTATKVPCVTACSVKLLLTLWIQSCPAVAKVTKTGTVVWKCSHGILVFN